MVPPATKIYTLSYTTLFRSRLKREQPDLLGKLSAVAVRADLGDKGTYYRIQAGPLSDGAAAERLCGELRQRSGLRSEEHTSELQSHVNLVCRLLLEKKKRCH